MTENYKRVGRCVASYGNMIADMQNEVHRHTMHRGMVGGNLWHFISSYAPGDSTMDTRVSTLAKELDGIRRSEEYKKLKGFQSRLDEFVQYYRVRVAEVTVAPAGGSVQDLPRLSGEDTRKLWM